MDNSMVELYKPKLEDLHFKQTMLADEATMSYNHAYGGTLPFPMEKWAGWYDRWIVHHDGKRFYRYIRKKDTFLGEAAYHLDEERKIYLADVIVYAPYRGKGYGHAALRLLCDAAKENGIRALYDEIAIDNPAIILFQTCGFDEISRTEQSVLVKKIL